MIIFISAKSFTIGKFITGKPTRIGFVRTWRGDKTPLELTLKLSCTIQRHVRTVHSVIYVPPMLRDVLDCGRDVDNCCCCFWI